MKEKVRHIILRLHPKRVPEILSTFLKDESISGKLVLGATALALIAINSPLQGLYDDFWQLHLSIGLGSSSLSMDLRHWVSEGLMAIFFLVVGLEIKREIVHGELREFKKAILPIGAAVGGMIVPALIYLSMNLQPDVIRGWGIPIATDIAFAIAVLTLLGKRVPQSVKIFLLTLAIVDDIGAIFVIALFYAEIIHYGYLATSFALLLLMWLMRKKLAGRLLVFLALGSALWVTAHLSGIHASIVGAALGLIAPLRVKSLRIPVAQRLEKLFLPISTFIVLPIFAFANAGVVISAQAFISPSSASVMGGIVLGLVIGKTIGIVGASWLMVRFANARLPLGARWSHIVGVGLTAGIGFTVSIFITELAFGSNQQLVETAKIGIFIASALSALLGTVVLIKAKTEDVV